MFTIHPLTNDSPHQLSKLTGVSDPRFQGGLEFTPNEGQYWIEDRIILSETTGVNFRTGDDGSIDGVNRDEDRDESFFTQHTTVLQ